jgi:hypothetical protein
LQFWQYAAKRQIFQKSENNYCGREIACAGPASGVKTPLLNDASNNECKNRNQKQSAASADVQYETGNFKDPNVAEARPRWACRKRSWEAYQCLYWSVSNHALYIEGRGRWEENNEDNQKQFRQFGNHRWDHYATRSRSRSNHNPIRTIIAVRFVWKLGDDAGGN